MKKRFIISGGGTGGHIFPAIAIANRLCKEIPEAEILFIGAKDKMEMKRVPEAGYPIEGLDIYGICRDFSLKGMYKNARLPVVLSRCMNRVGQIMRDFRPDAVIGVGGFASGPALRSAAKAGIPTLIQEQNSFPGVTNKLLSKRVDKICVAYEGLEKYFPKEKIVLTGNPVRDSILEMGKKEEEAYRFFGFRKDRKTILVVGGSLGARTINECMRENLHEIEKRNTQLIWQTGESFYQNIPSELLERQNERIRIVPFIKEMDKAYSIADSIISRAGAIAISELAIVGAPVILVPFPYASEDHQTKNAQALADRQAACLIPDQDASSKLIPQLLELLDDEERARELSENIRQFARPHAIDAIIQEIITL